MNEKLTFHQIAHIRTDFPAKFGIPRQSGLADIRGKIVFEKTYRSEEAIRGVEEYSHLWLLWAFSASVRDGWSPTVRPPRLGGNERVGVFASRSPFRPNPIGLSCVRLEAVETDDRLGPVLYVRGADLMDKTPILDIKPYLPYVDSHPEAAGGFSEKWKDYRLDVAFPKECEELFEPEELRVLKEVLSQDPRPSYQNDPERIYGMAYAGREVKFRAEGGRIIVIRCEQAKSP